jgi:hypothetical protein
MARDVQPRQLSGVALVAALVVLVAFAVLVGVLISQVDTGETRWARLAWVFASVEAIAFGAAGALFGSSIQRQRAERAETEAAEHREAAANGRALAEVIKADAPTNGAAPGGAGSSGGIESLGPGGRPAPQDELARRHAEVARRLFP